MSTFDSIIHILYMASTSQASLRLANTLISRNSTSFVCRSCRCQALRQRINVQEQSRYASDQPIPFTEKVRRKIWGTDNPPGMKDPYGGPSFLEKRRMRRNAEERREYLPHEEESYKEDAETDQMVEASQKLQEQGEEYIPAETWDGLEHMGHKGHWADIPPKPEDFYRSFTSAAVFDLQTRQDIVKCMSEARADVLVLDETGPEDSYIPTGAIDLQRPETFSILKRFTQLSGVHIRDPVISKCKTWEMLIDTVAKDVGPKPRNVAERLQMKESLAGLPNLKIMSRRETPVDKEKEVGRWKVIEAELQSRGLPVLGKLAS